MDHTGRGWGRSWGGDTSCWAFRCQVVDPELWGICQLSGTTVPSPLTHLHCPRLPLGLVWRSCGHQWLAGKNSKEEDGAQAYLEEEGLKEPGSFFPQWARLGVGMVPALGHVSPEVGVRPGCLLGNPMQHTVQSDAQEPFLGRRLPRGQGCSGSWHQLVGARAWSMKGH